MAASEQKILAEACILLCNLMKGHHTWLRSLTYTMNELAEPLGVKPPHEHVSLTLLVGSV